MIAEEDIRFPDSSTDIPPEGSSSLPPIKVMKSEWETSWSEEQTASRSSKISNFPGKLTSTERETQEVAEFIAMMQSAAKCYDQRNQTALEESSGLYWESDTASQGCSLDILGELAEIFYSVTNLYFEDGMETEFSNNVISFIMRYRKQAIDTLGQFIQDTKPDPRLVSEALYWIGEIEDHTTHRDRRILCERLLEHPSPCVRDGAVIGLASLDDPEAIPSLEKALEQEPFESLKKYIQQAITELQETLLENE